MNSNYGGFVVKFFVGILIFLFSINVFAKEDIAPANHGLQQAANNISVERYRQLEKKKINYVVGLNYMRQFDYVLFDFKNKVIELYKNKRPEILDSSFKSIKTSFDPVLHSKMKLNGELYNCIWSTGTCPSTIDPNTHTAILGCNFFAENLVIFDFKHQIAYIRSFGKGEASGEQDLSNIMVGGPGWGVKYF